VTFGVKSVASFRVLQTRDLGIGGSAFTVHHGRRDTEFVMPLLGAHNITNALAAITVGASHGVPWEDMQAAGAGLKPAKMRGEVIRFQLGFAAIDDSYNSNPRALTE